MTNLTPTRRVDTTSAFIAPFTLPGWEDYSIWGYDRIGETWFAQLWRNSDDATEVPRHWLGANNRLATIDALAVAIGIDIRETSHLVRAALKKIRFNV
jgi:hypothetical protein